MVKWSVKWLVPSFVAMPFLLVWYLFMVPASQRALLTLGIDTINSGTFSTVTRMALVIIITSATIIVVAYYPRLSQSDRIQPLACAGGSAAGTDGHRRRRISREMLRKPYVIGRWMYSNGVRVPYVNQDQSRRVIWLTRTGCGTASALLPRATPAAKRSSAANAVRAIRSTAIVRLRNCSKDAIAPTSATSS